MGGSFKLLFIAIYQRLIEYNIMVCLFLVQEAKELAEIKDIKHYFMICSIIMPRCACASEVYGSVLVCLCVCVCVCVCVCLCRLLQLLKDQ